jgi:signal peptidase I
MTLKWFFSSTVRQADQMRKHVQKILNAQRDLLDPRAIDAVQASINDLHNGIRAGLAKKELMDKMAALEKSANGFLKPYPNAALRENIEVLLVAIAVAMGIRTFFLQPFKIPTGSMQPTLYGITSNPDFSPNAGFSNELAPNPDFEIPNHLVRFFQFWINGVQYKELTARTEGRLESYNEPSHLLLFNLWQTFKIGGETYTVWFPPDNLLKRAGLLNYYGHPNPRVFKVGETLYKIKVTSGDHLFVDRLSYNFRHPKRGEIIVFETKGIISLRDDQFYIKRMVAMGGEKVQIGNDRHLVIDGKRLDASTPHFENVYSFDPSQPPRPSQYSGHVNGFVMREYNSQGDVPLFQNGNTVVEVPPNNFMVMGDNTLNSSDSRYWGPFSRTNVIGKSFFVYWPFGAQNGHPSRFGWGQQ